MFVIAGEALIDLFAGSDGSYTPIPGGAPYNFTRALALQDLAAGYVNPFSEDAFGALLKDTLLSSGAKHLGRMSRKPTSLALVATNELGQPRYSFYRDGVADRDMDAAAVIAAEAKAVIGFHTGALALVPPDHQHMLDAMNHFRKLGALCTVDVNMRPQVARSLDVAIDRYREAVLAVIANADIVKVSDEDLQHLGFPDAPQASAKALLERGCKVVALTLGDEGAWVFSAATEIYQAPQPVRVVDTVGAGDCFFAGFIASLQRQNALSESGLRSLPSAVLKAALRHAAICAAIDIGRKGCQPPTWDEAVRWKAGEA